MFGKTESVSYCDQSRESFAYDGEGNLLVHTKPSGNQITYTYDGFGSLTGRKGGSRQDVYTYDEAGRLSSAGNGGITYHYSYDNCGRLAEKKACGRSLIRYGYDRNGNVSVIRDVTGKETSYVYDYENRLKSIEENGRVLAEYRYTPGGKVSSVTCGDVVTSYGYDRAGNNTVITTEAGDARISRIRYGYDSRGNCIRREYEDFRGMSGRVEYAYDGADRLIREERSSGPLFCYEYDRAGNRVRMEEETGGERLVTGYVYDDRNRLAELTKSGLKQAKVTFAYDPDGNMTNDGRGIYGYDEFDRMVSAVMETGDSLVCRYDAEGLRYETEENERLFSYIYHGRQVVTETSEGSTTRYIRGNGRLVASDSEKARTYYHYISDRQGSVRYVADSGVGKTDEAVSTDFGSLDERIWNRYEYDAFGNLLECEERVYNPFRYTGEQYDRTTQLYYLKARYYNPVIGRFMQQDTYLGDGLNLYAYVQNNPVRYVDPSGHCKTNEVDSSYEKHFEDLSKYRKEQGMPVAGSVEDRHTAAKLLIGDKVFYGRNGHGKQEKIKSVFTVNPQTATHAESDVFYQAKVSGETSTSAILITDRRACKACGINGGIRSLARQMGITDLTIVSPGYEPIRFNPQVKPKTNPFMNRS